MSLCLGGSLYRSKPIEANLFISMRSMRSKVMGLINDYPVSVRDFESVLEFLNTG
jgi:hypothetical protein